MTDQFIAPKSARRASQDPCYAFDAPPDSCFGYGASGIRKYIPALAGRILVDEATGYLVQYEETTSEGLPDFPFASVREVIRWDDVKIGEAAPLVPVAYEYSIGMVDGDRRRIHGEFQPPAISGVGQPRRIKP